MERLTKDNDTQYDLIGNYNSNIEEFTNNHKLRNSVLNKLGQLEDIEEELGENKQWQQKNYKIYIEILKN